MRNPSEGAAIKKTIAGKNTEEGARTLDLWIHNPVLYQLSYLGIGQKPKHFILRHPNSEAKSSPMPLLSRSRGAIFPSSLLFIFLSPFPFVTGKSGKAP